MWSRLARIRQLQKQISARVQLAVEAEDFSKAEEIYVLQKLAEDCIDAFRLSEMQGRKGYMIYDIYEYHI